MRTEAFYGGLLLLAPMLGEAWRRAMLSGGGGTPADRVARAQRGMVVLSLAAMGGALALACGPGEQMSSSALVERSWLALALVFWAMAGINLSLMRTREAFGETSPLASWGA